MNRQPQP